MLLHVGAKDLMSLTQRLRHRKDFHYGGVEGDWNNLETTVWIATSKYGALTSPLNDLDAKPESDSATFEFQFLQCLQCVGKTTVR